MNFKKHFAIILSITLLLSILSGCRKMGGDGSLSDTSSLSSLVYSNVDIIANESSEPQSVVETVSQNESVVSETANSTPTESTVSVEDPVTNINPDGIEIYGSGTADDPYIDTPNADTHTVKTLSIPAGKSVFYSIYRVGGRILTINSADAYVVCDGTKHTASGGKVSFKVIDALASDAVTFEIGNTGTVAANFAITFSDLVGSMANPTILNSIGSKTSVSFEEGNEIGHFYKYTAEKDGTIRFYLLSGTEKGILLATNNRNSAQRSTESTEEGEVKTDDTGTYIELEVTKGDEIVINIGAKPNARRKYPAVTLEWMAQY